MPDAPNVLLVVADSLRARNCSVTGYRRETTPFLDAFAREATVYTQARSPSNWTVPSHVSLFTGYEVPEHGFDHSMELDPGHTVFEALSETGYTTALFSDNPFLTDHESALDRPFDYVRGTPEEYADRYRTGGDLGEWPNGFYYADRFLEWTADREEPWAACINLMDPHRPYEPREEYDRWSDERVREIQGSMGYKWHWEFLSGSTSLGFARLLESIYDGAIRQTDAIFERVIAGLDDTDSLDDTLVVFTGDHGEGFGEPTPLESEGPAVSHRIGTHDALYHVPLVVRRPGQRDGERITDLATLSRVPEVVRSVTPLETDGTDTTFTTDRCVAAQAPIGPAMAEEAERICGDADPYTRHARIVYEDRPGDEVHRLAAWGADACETTVRGRRATTDEHGIDSERVMDVFETFESVDIGTPLAEMTEFEDASKTEFGDDLEDRLDALGYR